MKKQKIRESKGITMVTLVITIIILIILSAISLAGILGKNGIINQAIEASDKHQLEKDREKIKLIINEYSINKLESSSGQTIEQGLKSEEMQELAELFDNNKCYYVLLTSSNIAKLEIKENLTEFNEINIKVEKKSKYTFIVNNKLEIAKVLKNGEEIPNQPEEPEKPDVPEEPEEPEITHKTEVPEGWIGIYTEEDLKNVANDLTANYILMADINLTETTTVTDSNWTAIGTSSKPFTGKIDGNNYKISNLQIGTKTTSSYQGLFGYTRSGEIKDLTIETTSTGINGGSYIGGLVGYNNGATIENVSVKGNVTGTDNIGGLIGYNNGNVTNARAEGTIKGMNYTGGLIGQKVGGTVESCKTSGKVIINNNGNRSYIGGLIGYNNGNIIKSYSESTIITSTTSSYNCNYVGGLVGINSSLIEKSASSGNVQMYTGNGIYIGGLVGQNNSTITNSYSTGEVEGIQYVGGMIGYNNGNVTNTYTISKVKGNSYLGGLIGYNYSGTITNSYWTKERSGQGSSAGGTILTLENLEKESSYTNWRFKQNDNDTEYIWYMKNGLPELNF